MAFPFINAILQYFDNSGNVLSGGLLYTYAPGTTTPKTTYTDENLSVPNANPIVLDSAGRCVIFLADGEEYKFVLQTSAGVVIKTVDEVKSPTALTQANIGAGLYPISSAETAATVTPTNYFRPYGDIRRYGADTAAANNATAIQAAINVFAQGGPAVYIPSGSFTITTALTGAEGLNMYGDGRLKSEILVSGAIKGFVYTPGALQDAALRFQSFKVRGTASALQLFDITDCILCVFEDMQIRTTSLQCVRFQGECDSIVFRGCLIESWTTAAVAFAGSFNNVNSFQNTQFNCNNDITSTGAAILVTGGLEILDIRGVNLNGNSTNTPLLNVSNASASRIGIRHTYAEGITASAVVASGTAQILGLEVEDCNFSTTNSVRVDLANSQAHTNVRIRRVRSPDTAAGFVLDPGTTSDFEYDGAEIGGSLAHVNGWGTDRWIQYNSTRVRGTRFTVGPFTATNTAAAQTDAPLSGNRWVAPRGGSVVGIVGKLNEARTAGTKTFTVFKNTGLAGATGATIGLTAVIDGTNTSSKATTQAPNLDTFVAGDEIFPVQTTDGSWAPTTADDLVWIEVEM